MVHPFHRLWGSVAIILFVFPLMIFSGNAFFALPKQIGINQSVPLPTAPTGGDPFPQPPLRAMGSYGARIDAFAAHGDNAYVIEGHRIRMLSYADPANITIQGEIFNARPFMAVQLSSDGSRLFALAGSTVFGSTNELVMYDVSDPTQPRLVMNLRRKIAEVHLYRERLYLRAEGAEIGQDQLQVWSWEGDRLSKLGETRFYGYGRYWFEDDVLLMAPYYPSNSHYEIHLYDISDDTAPTWKGDILTIGGVAVVVNDYLYVSNGDGQSNGGYVDIWDIHDMDHPTIVQTLPRFYLYAIAKRDDVVLASNGRFYDFSQPFAPELIGTVADSTYFYMPIWDEARTFYTLHYQTGSSLHSLERIELTENFEVVLEGSYTPPWQYAAVPVTERYLYLFGTTSAGIDIHDMQEPARPRYVATVLKDEFTWAPARDYFIVDDRLYLFLSGNITILDVREPLAPTVVATIPLGTNWSLESVQNGYLYALHRNTNQIYALRLSDLVGESIFLPNTANCKGLDTEGAMMAVTCESLRLYDISNPIAPTLLGTLPTTLDLMEPTLALPSLFVTTRSQVAIYDVSNPASPTYVTSVGQPYPTVAEDGTPPSDTLGGYVCPELVALEPGYYLRQCYYDQGYPMPAYGITDIVDLRTPTAPRRSESMNMLTSRGVVQGDTLLVASANFTVWQIRLFLERAIFIPVAQTR